MTPDLYPLKLEPRVSPRIWGGSRIAAMCDLKGHEAEGPLGELWQVYDSNEVLNGPFAGATLGDVVAHHGEALLGHATHARFGPEFPLLAKLIDSADKPSIQVHPDDDYARRFEAATGFTGKTEAWYVLEAEPEAHIIRGFKHGLTKDQVRAEVEAGRILDHLNVVPVAAGDVVFNAAGMLHGPGPGVFFFEIMQRSDLTYRIYDYGRRDADGNLRELHLDKALDVLDLTVARDHGKSAPRRCGPGKELLVTCPYFALERWEVAGVRQEASRQSTFDILTVVRGAATLRHDGGDVALSICQSVVLPARLGAFELHGDATVLSCYVPEPAR